MPIELDHSAGIDVRLLQVIKAALLSEHTDFLVHVPMQVHPWRGSDELFDVSLLVHQHVGRHILATGWRTAFPLNQRHQAASAVEVGGEPGGIRRRSPRAKGIENCACQTPKGAHGLPCPPRN